MAKFKKKAKNRAQFGAKNGENGENRYKSAKMAKIGTNRYDFLENTEFGTKYR